MAQNFSFLPVPEHPVFPAEEERILQFWEQTDAFQEAKRQSQAKPVFNFYDGPPFATGLPHYGHILAGTIKDCVLRHAHQRGFHIEPRFGWDCHGVPIEGIIDKEKNIKGRADVMEFGLENYNEACRAIVLKYEKEWYRITARYGRWIDMEDNWKTMDLSYMESVWWVFKQLWEKGMVYRAHRVIGYSTALSTPLSNFEVAQNYKEVSDPSVIVQFKRTDRPNSWILCWTTTPWSLPTNVALCVHPQAHYVMVQNRDNGQEWICGKDRFSWVCSLLKKREEDFVLLAEMQGQQLEGIPYEPVFDYYRGKVKVDKCWRVVCDAYVAASAGTMVVHQAPAYGEDDMRVCKAHGIIDQDGSGMPDPLDDAGCFKADVFDFEGLHVKSADKGLVQKLKEKGYILFAGSEVHNYPHCWRSDTPLIYRAIPAWFIKVEAIRERLLRCNAETYWVPEFVKEKRFKNWLQEARDWCVSRSRYWGTPLPIWVSDDFEEMICVGSVAELEQLSGRKFVDIHRHHLDGIQIPSKLGKGMLKRIPEVFDCWFESGSMPYASKHYPFENKAEWETSFPAQFIGEGLDQTRGWFYSLMVIGTILFDKPPFLNLICNGLVLASDGKKMSKRLQNYPDPSDMFGRYGADAVRMYMLNSPVVRAEPLRFKEEGVKDVVKDVFLPLYNAYRFLVLETSRFEKDGKKFEPTANMVKDSTNLMDKWIRGCMHSLIQFVREEMDAFRLYTVAGGVNKLLRDLTNWYVRLNRDRMRGKHGTEEALAALGTLFTVILNTAILMAPITPFITELLYQNLSRALPEGHVMKAKSVHFVMVPESDPSEVDAQILLSVERMQSVVELARLCREQRKVSSKVPVRSLVIFHQSKAFLEDVKRLEVYIKDEVNVIHLDYRSDTEHIMFLPVLNFKLLGKRLGKDMRTVQEAAKCLGQEELLDFDRTGQITIAGHEISKEEMSLHCQVADSSDPCLQVNGNAEITVVMDFTSDQELQQMAMARSVVNAIQKLRKELKLQANDPVDMWAGTMNVDKCQSVSKLQDLLTSKASYIDTLLQRRLWPARLKQGHEVDLLCKEFSGISEGEVLTIHFSIRGPFFNDKEMRDLVGSDADAERCLRLLLQSFDSVKLSEICKHGSIEANHEGKTYTLLPGKHFAVGPGGATWLD